MMDRVMDELASQLAHFPLGAVNLFQAHRHLLFVTFGIILGSYCFITCLFS